MKKEDTPVVKTPKVSPNPGQIFEEPQPIGGTTSAEANDAQAEVPEAPSK